MSRRIGRRERTRVKKSRLRKAQVWSGLGAVSLASGPMGRKHLHRWYRWADRLREIELAEAARRMVTQ